MDRAAADRELAHRELTEIGRICIQAERALEVDVATRNIEAGKLLRVVAGRNVNGRAVARCKRRRIEHGRVAAAAVDIAADVEQRIRERNVAADILVCGIAEAEDIRRAAGGHRQRSARSDVKRIVKRPAARTGELYTATTVDIHMRISKRRVIALHVVDDRSRTRSIDVEPPEAIVHTGEFNLRAAVERHCAGSAGNSVVEYRGVRTAGDAAQKKRRAVAERNVGLSERFDVVDRERFAASSQSDGRAGRNAAVGTRNRRVAGEFQSAAGRHRDGASNRRLKRTDRLLRRIDGNRTGRDIKERGIAERFILS